MGSRAARPRTRRGSPYRFYGALAAVLSASAVIALVWFQGVGWYGAWLVGVGVVTFALYAWDKQRAQAGGGRVPERVLQALVLLGGVLGGWAGMLLLRHKTRHGWFWVVQWTATLLWAALGLVILT